MLSTDNFDNFCHLHVHSMASILDGLPLPEELPARAKELGQTSISITDHGSMAGILRFVKACKELDIKPLIGIEAYVAEDRHSRNKEDLIYHMGLIAQTDEGLKNLYKLSEIGWTEGFYKKPRLDKEVLDKYGDGVIILTGCMDGVLNQNFREDNIPLAKDWASFLIERFSGRLYAEIQPWNGEELNGWTMGIADEYDIPVVATADTHYCKQDESGYAEVGLTIQITPELKAKDKRWYEEHQEEALAEKNWTKRLNMLFPERGLSFEELDNYVMSRASMERRMQEVGIDRTDIYDNTVLLADSVNAEIPLGMNYFPRYSKNLDSNDYLSSMALDKLEERGLADKPGYLERLKEELFVIRSLNFSDYMLLIWDMVNYAHANDIYVGPGRGSVGGSLLAYVLGIVRVDPMKYGLEFGRFLSTSVKYEPEFGEVNG